MISDDGATVDIDQTNSCVPRRWSGIFSNARKNVIRYA
jgi:hypothetical protein